MFSIPGNLAHSLRPMSISACSHLNIIQHRTISNFFIRFPLHPPTQNCQSLHSLLGRTRILSAQESLAVPAFSPKSLATSTLPSEKESQKPILIYFHDLGKNSQANKIEDVKKKINYFFEANKEAEKKNYKNAIKYYTLYISQNSNPSLNSHVKYCRANLYRKIGEFDKAIKDFKEAAQEMPNVEETENCLLDLSYTYQEKGEISKATETLQEGIKLDPSAYFMHYEIGEIYLKTNNAKPALEHLEKVISLIGDSPCLQMDPNLSKFLLDIKTATLQLQNSTDADVPEICAQLLKAKERFGYHPLYMG